MKTIYFVLGMHRSGTSALSGVLNIMGLDFGSDLMKADSRNPKGYYENNFVYALNEKILKENNSSWDDYNFDPKVISSEKKEIYINNISKLINHEFKYSDSFVIKDPRICILFPLWEEACLKEDINIKIILPYRNPIEVAQSLKKRNDFSQEKSLILWSKHFLNAEYLSRKYDRFFVFFDELIKNTLTIKELANFTNSDLNKSIENEIKDFLDKSIKHNNISLKNFSKEVPSFLYELIEVIKNKDFINTNNIDKCRNDFTNSLKFFQHIELEDKYNEQIKKTEVLEKLVDITSIDEDYYIKGYPDLAKFDGTLKTHYMKYGKKEGRFPNKYCEINNIDVKNKISKDEIIYQKDINIQELNTQKETLESNYNEKAQEVENLNKNIDEILQDLETVKQKKEILRVELDTQKEENIELFKSNSNLSEENDSLNINIQELNTQKETLESNYNEKAQEVENLNKNIDEILKDLETVKQKKQNTIEELNQIKIELETQKEKNVELLEVNNNLDNILEKEQKENSELSEENLNLNINIEELSTQKETLESNYNQKAQEVENLNKNIDEILNDLEIVKQSRKLVVKKLNKNIDKIIEEKENLLKIIEKQKQENNNISEKNHNQNKNIDELNIQIETLNDKYNQKIKEIETLNNNIDQIVSDLASIKESRCWIYTKPIRKLQKTLRGKKNV